MQYAEAFKALGYTLLSPRQDWSTANDTGVCLSLWRVELAMRNRLPWFNTKLHGRPISKWGFKPGNKLRIAHFALATATSDGFVDVIIVSGVPGGPYGDATPWISADRKGRWRLADFDSQTGHFEVSVVPD
jgi:hypothetical protein